MSSTTANLMEHVLPEGVPLRQWVLTFPFPWRKRLGYDGPLLSALTRIFITTVLAFYTRKMAVPGRGTGQSGAVVALQRSSSDLKLNPHIHALFLDGVYREMDASKDADQRLLFEALPHLSTREVSSVLERATKRMKKYLRRRRLLDEREDDSEEDEGLAVLAASATLGMTPPAGPEWRRGALHLVAQPMTFERPLSVALDGFTLHAATRAGGLDGKGREALLKYILRPPIAQERVTQGPDGLVRIALKKVFSDGTFAVDLDPLSLLARLCAAVPPPKLHTIRYAGVLGAASKIRPHIVPKPAEEAAPAAAVVEPERKPKPQRHGCSYRSWAELMKRTFSVDVLMCPRCGGRLRLVALMTEPKSIARYLRALGEPIEAPSRAPARGPPFWQSRVLRRQAGVNDAA
jgi:hypothetical protein